MERFSNLVPSFVRSLPDDPEIVEKVVISLWRRPWAGDRRSLAGTEFAKGRLVVSTKDKNWKPSSIRSSPSLSPR